MSSAAEPKRPVGWARLRRRPLTVALEDTWSLLFGMAILMLGHGLQGTLLGVRASLEGFPTAVTGLVMSGYFAGLLVGSFATPALVARAGHVRVFAALLSLGSTAILFHALLVDPIAWFAMRFLTGLCFSGAFICAESWLNEAATNENRGRLLGIYMLIQFGGYAAGQFLLNLADPMGFPLFLVVSVLISVAAVPMLLAATHAPEIEAPKPVSLRELYRVSPLGVVGIIGVGLSHAALFSIGPVFARDEGLSVAAISTFMAVFVLGGAVFQLPVGRLSDRLDRRLVITLVTLLTAAVAATAGVIDRPQVSLLYALFFLIGGLALPMYALCAAHTNDFLGRQQMVGASSAMLLAYGIGAALGPTLASLVMASFGARGLPGFIVLVHGGVGVFALYRMTRRAPRPNADQPSYAGLPNASPVPLVSHRQDPTRDTGPE